MSERKLLQYAHFDEPSWVAGDVYDVNLGHFSLPGLRVGVTL